MKPYCGMMYALFKNNNIPQDKGVPLLGTFFTFIQTNAGTKKYELRVRPGKDLIIYIYYGQFQIGSHTV